MTKLNGKIVWINDDFSYNGVYKAITRDYSTHSVTKVNNCIVDDNMISFYTEPYEVEKEIYSYKVNLVVTQNANRFQGHAIYADGEPANIQVSCELFSNKNSYFLYGKWEEDEVYYSWWAIIKRN